MSALVADIAAALSDVRFTLESGHDRKLSSRLRYVPLSDVRREGSLSNQLVEQRLGLL